MYRAFVRRQILRAFDDLTNGNTGSLLARMAPDVHHAFPGHHALGGTRTDLDDVTTWFGRLDRLLPGLAFQVRAVAVDGNPLDTRVGVEWNSSATLADGYRYGNRGAHMIRLRRGRIASFHAYLDDGEHLAATLRHLAAQGVTEAVAEPILSTVS